jgi:hypothetical protein
MFSIGPFDRVVHPARKIICRLALGQKISHLDKSRNVMVFPLEQLARIWCQPSLNEVRVGL